MCFPLKEQTLYFTSVVDFFFFNPVGIISSRICSFILSDSWQSGSLEGVLLQTGYFTRHLLKEFYINKLVFIIYRRLEQKLNGAKCE